MILKVGPLDRMEYVEKIQQLCYSSKIKQTLSQTAKGKNKYYLSQNLDFNNFLKLKDNYLTILVHPLRVTVKSDGAHHLTYTNYCLIQDFIGLYGIISKASKKNINTF